MLDDDTCPGLCPDLDAGSLRSSLLRLQPAAGQDGQEPCRGHPEAEESVEEVLMLPYVSVRVCPQMKSPIFGDTTGIPWWLCHTNIFLPTDGAPILLMTFMNNIGTFIIFFMY